MLLGVATGSRSALTQLYDATAPSVFGLVTRMIADPSAAEKVTEEIFVRIWLDASRFDPIRETCRTWIVTIAHEQAVLHLRATAPAIVRDAGAAPARPPGQGAGRREILELAFFDGLDQREIAARTGIPLCEVMSLTRAGLDELFDAAAVARGVDG